MPLRSKVYTSVVAPASMYTLEHYSAQTWVCYCAAMRVEAFREIAWAYRIRRTPVGGARCRAFTRGRSVRVNCRDFPLECVKARYFAAVTIFGCFYSHYFALAEVMNAHYYEGTLRGDIFPQKQLSYILFECATHVSYIHQRMAISCFHSRGLRKHVLTLSCVFFWRNCVWNF